MGLQQKKKKKKGMATALPQAKCHFWLCSKDILFAGDLPGSSGAKTQCFHCKGHGLDPWSGNQDPTCLAVWPERKRDVVQAFPRTPALQNLETAFPRCPGQRVSSQLDSTTERQSEMGKQKRKRSGYHLGTLGREDPVLAPGKADLAWDTRHLRLTHGLHSTP